ncbi:superfamily II DNA/RNA helicase [Streptomyces sp. SAI-135]|uniref:DEAD/DEAH box helicase n=1 Tax=unclassified Streptomyces TaxID=2593676 RepID=UPI0024759B95|nr:MULTISPECIES: DEAD/DEAH box helicase [unclassified Streptomyces]MDH6516679.1 superfamily II DNA/RNA helicase [Streptomyces sp. SAI-090]MDH6619232.1 superfamily II DNA/RNA helicase [Streptomyces sp. SAI-135]
MTLPVALSGSDVIGQAKTGTGKTLGFGLPLLERVTVPADVEAGRARPEALTDAPQALVVVPTRELCTQVTNDLQTAGKVRNVRVLAIYGGRAYEPQVEALKKGVDVVVGTPGRLLDLAGQKKLNLGHIKALVLDEADEMLDLGFLPDVEKIINMLPARRQTMLFSATMPGAVISLARRYMSQPTHINATSPDDAGRTVANTKQHVYRAHNMDKPEMVARILQADGRGLAMVFCRTKRTAADLADQLQQRGFAAGAVHGDLGQGAREQALRAFRNGKVDVLVCTDVAARGIDVEGVTHVINYQSPEEEKTYLHRIGRTGRAGAKGIAITLVDWDDIPRWQLINKALELDFNDPPETYSTSPHFYEDLGIPAGTKGVLPRTERTRAGLDAEELEDLGEPGGRGARGRGDRDRGRGRGGRDESRSADRERSERTPRRRRRTRGGTPLDASAPVEAVAPSETTAVEDAPATRTPRRRRRTRGGASDSAPATTTATAAASTAAAPVEPAVSEPAESAVATAEGPALDTETPAKPRRRRIRKSAETPAAVETVVETAPVTETAAVTEAAPVAGTAPAAEAPATKPRRTRKTAATAPAEAAVDTAEATEAKPRRTRKTAAATTTAAETAVDTAEGTVTKPRRTRKTAAATTEAAADTAETVEAKPRRTRKTAAAAPAEAVVDTAEATEAKPRRRTTRKAAEPAVTAEIPVQTAPEPETAEVVKPRRTRKTASTATAAEAAVDTAEGTVTKPRRTRKTAAAPVETAADTAETAEVKPRRTRKTAAKATATTAAEVATDTAEAKPRRRTTRKAAEPTVTADIPAQADQEPKAAAPRRRTRKTAAAEPADS